MSTFDFLSNDSKDYPLHPYLEYKKSLHHINQLTVSDVQSFEKKHRKLPFVKTIRSRYLDHLAKNERWADFKVANCCPAILKAVSVTTIMRKAKRDTQKQC